MLQVEYFKQEIQLIARENKSTENMIQFVDWENFPYFRV